MTDPYDPHNGPTDQWLALDDEQRVNLIAQYHQQTDDHPTAPNPDLHAAFHNLVESQVSTDDRVAAVLDRLVDEGLSRHAAVHAVGAVVQKHIKQAQQNNTTIDEDAYIEELQTLKASDFPAHTD